MQNLLYLLHLLQFSLQLRDFFCITRGSRKIYDYTIQIYRWPLCCKPCKIPLAAAEENKILKQLCTYSERRKRCENPDLIAVNNGIFNYKEKILYNFTPELVLLTQLYKTEKSLMSPKQ